jgi:DNA polymerase-3 subunit epsilon
MGRCCSPCLGDLDPNAYRRQVDAALALFDHPDGAREALLSHIDARIGEASAARRYEAAGALLRRRERLEGLLDRLDGVLRAVHADPRLVVASHPSKERHDAFLVVAGRVVDWGPLPQLAELRERCRRALERPGGREPVRPGDVDEVRIAAAWIAEHDPPALGLEPAPSPRTLAAFVRRAVAQASSATARSAA